MGDGGDNSTVNARGGTETCNAALAKSEFQCNVEQIMHEYNAKENMKNLQEMILAKSNSSTSNKDNKTENTTRMKSIVAANCVKNEKRQLEDHNVASDDNHNANGKNNSNNNNKNNKNTDTDIYAHYEPKVRLLRIRKTVMDACGFHLTRTKWDPYPWVSAVDAHTPAEMCGLTVGDCILEVNGEDVLGLRITDIAKLVKAKSGHVTLLLWSSGCDLKCDPESLCCAPMPRSLQRLSVIVQSILAIIECPVCLDTIPPPVMQCQNGHLLCVNCRILAEKCPVCRDRYTPRRALIAEQIYTAITNAYNLCRNEDKLREKLFGQVAMRPNMRDRTKDTPTIDTEQQLQRKQKSKSKTKMRLKENQHVALDAAQAGLYTLRNNVTEAIVEVGGSEVTSTPLPTTKSKFLTKLWLRKAYSMGNIAAATATTATTAKTTTKVFSNGGVGCVRTGADTINDGTLTTGTGAMNPTLSDAAAAVAMTTETTMASSTERDNNYSNDNNNPAANKVQLFSNRSRIDAVDDEGDGADKCDVVVALDDAMANVGVVNGTMKNSKNHLTSMHNTRARNANAASEKLKKLATTRTCTATITATATAANAQALPNATTNSVAHVTALSQLCAATTFNDLLQTQHAQQTQQQQQQQKQLRDTTTRARTQTQIQLTATRSPPLQRLPNVFNSRTTDNDSSNNNNCSNNGTNCKSDNATNSRSSSLDKSSALLLLDKRRPTCHTRRSAAIACSRKQFSLSTEADDNDIDADGDFDDVDCSLAANSNKNCTHSSMHAPAIAASASQSPASSRSSSSGVFLASTDSSNLGVGTDAATHHETAINNAILSLSPRLVDTINKNTISQDTTSTASSGATTLLLTMDAAQQAVTTPVFADGDTATISLASTQLDSQLISTSSYFYASHCDAAHKHRLHYRCPCDCGECFNGTSQLQRHVKLVHGLPIVCFGGASARLALPLQQPVDNAVLILEAHSKAPHNASDDACEIVEGGEGVALAGTEIDDKCNIDNKDVIDSRTAQLQQQQQRQPHNECPQQDTKECWIRIKAQGDCIHARALWQAYETESADYVLEMRLNIKDAVVELQLKELKDRPVAAADALQYQPQQQWKNRVQQQQ